MAVLWKQYRGDVYATTIPRLTHFLLARKMEARLIYEFALQEALLITALHATSDAVTDAAFCQGGTAICLRTHARTPREAERRLRVHLTRIQNRLDQSQTLGAKQGGKRADKAKKGRRLSPPKDISVAELSKIEQSRYLGCLLEATQRQSERLLSHLPPPIVEQLTTLEERTPVSYTRPLLDVIRQNLKELALYVTPPSEVPSPEPDPKMELYWTYVRRSDFPHVFQWLTYSRLLRQAIHDLSVENRLPLFSPADEGACGGDDPTLIRAKAHAPALILTPRKPPPLTQLPDAGGKVLAALFFLCLFLCALLAALAKSREELGIGRPRPLAPDVLLSPEVLPVVIHQDLRREGISRWLLRMPPASAPATVEKWVEGLFRLSDRILLVELDNLRLTRLADSAEFGWADWMKGKPQADLALAKLRQGRADAGATPGATRLASNIYFVPYGPEVEEWEPALERLAHLWDGAFHAVFFLVRNDRKLSKKKLRRCKLRVADMPAGGIL